MKTKVTTTIDSIIKSSFESTQHIHNKSYSEILEEAMLRVLEEISPLEAMHMAIINKEKELADLHFKYAELELLVKQEKARKKAEPQVNHELSDYLEEFRTEKFEKTRDSNITLWKKGDINWKKVISSYQFSSIDEAKEWFARKIEGIGGKTL